MSQTSWAFSLTSSLPSPYNFALFSPPCSKLTHQPALLFLRDPYLLPTNGKCTDHLQCNLTPLYNMYIILILNLEFSALNQLDYTSIKIK